MAGIYEWHNTAVLQAREYTCGFCTKLVASDRGYYVQGNVEVRVLICPNCKQPTYFEGELQQVPGVAYGNAVEGVPEGVGTLYDEARNCMKVSAYTSSVLACRKLLMNIAVAEGADEGKQFIEYVEYLSDEGYVPPKGKGWVDHIRKQGNEATHEIAMKSRSDAEELIAFVEMLLKFIYEFPSRVPRASTEDSAA